MLNLTLFTLNIVDKLLAVFLICTESTTSNSNKCARPGTQMIPLTMTYDILLEFKHQLKIPN